MRTPLYKRLKNSGTSFYTFPGAAEDINAAYQNENYRMYFSKFTLLNLPRSQNEVGGTQSQKAYFDFSTFTSLSQNPITNYGDSLVESLRNYVANHETTLRESRLNNTEYYYDTRALETTTEKIFWKWCKKMNLIEFELAIPEDEYFSDLLEFQRVELSDDTYFPEYLWKEREIREIRVNQYRQSTSSQFPGKLEFILEFPSGLRVGDIVELVNFDPSGQIAIDIWGNNSWEGVPSLKVIGILNTSGLESLILDFNYGGLSFNESSGIVKLKYNKLVRYIGEVTGVSNVQEANRSYTEVYAHVPAHCGETPDILFRTLPDVNYKPGLEFPIIPSQYQPEILGAELFSSPIVSNPSDYPGSFYGQFDSVDFTYRCEPGDTLRRSGRYYGVDGDINVPNFNPEALDGLVVDFNTSHYVKMNILDREVQTFDQFNSLEIGGDLPKDFEFNSILWYYTVEDLQGNIRTNLYGISFLDNPQGNTTPGEVGVRVPTYKKLVTNEGQDGTAYSLGLNLNFNIIHENPGEAFNPEAINSLFSMNLFNDAMRRLGNLNDSFNNTLSNQIELEKEIQNIKQLIYTQTELSQINSKISNLEDLLQLYSTLQIISSDTVSVNLVDGEPIGVELNTTDTPYNKLEVIKTSEMWGVNGSIPINVSPPINKSSLFKIINDDVDSFILPNGERLSLIITEDLSYRQSMEILITGSPESTQNKKLDIYITTTTPIDIGTPSIGDAITPDPTDFPPVETLLIGDVNLPVFFNQTTNSQNSASIWTDFKFQIDFNEDITINGDILKLKFSTSPLIVQNSIKVGDVFLLNDFLIGTSSVFDFSGQYSVDTIVGNEVWFDISSNLELVNFIEPLPAQTLTVHNPSSNQSILSNIPYFKLNKGWLIKIIRVTDLEDDFGIINVNEVPLNQKYHIDIRSLEF